MGRRHRAKQQSYLIQSEEARRLLKDDAPLAVKMRLRLCARGGRQGKRQCVACRRAAGIVCKIWSPPELWAVGSEGRDGIKVYWLCQQCNQDYEARGLPPEVERKLSG